MTTDGELVRRALQRDRPACEELVRRWAARVMALCHARTGNLHLAEDLAQETLLRAVRGLGTLDNPDKFGAWICGIATRVCFDWRKAGQSSQVNFSALSSNGKSADFPAPHSIASEIDGADEARRLLRTIEMLPEKYREVLMLFYYDDRSYREMADMLGVSPATINARLTQARATLRATLGCRRGETDEV